MRMHEQIKKGKGVHLKLELLRQYRASVSSILLVLGLPIRKHMCTKLAIGKPNRKLK